MNPILDIRSVNKSFAGHGVLNNISLQVTSNSIHGLVGLNGAGKTTLIKCILDLQSADSGEIHIHGLPSTATNARDRLIYLPERFSAPDYMSGWTYLKFIIDAYLPAQQRKTARAGIKPLCTKLDFEIKALDKLVPALSKGMSQKLALIGCLLSGKEFLILDEPMSGLDPKARILFKKVIEELRQEGKTILMCTHILLDIETLCDHASILHAGRMLFSGKPVDCCDLYQAEDFETAFLHCLEQNTTEA